jgi:adenine-specific DNA-methyltransferase
MVEMEDYSSAITAERVRRAIEGVPSAKNENLKQGLGGSFSYFDLGDAIDEVGILSGKSLPSYEQMARYLFYTGTGEEFHEELLEESKNYIGKSKDYEVYLFYKPDISYLKNTALNLKMVENLPIFTGKKRLIFAPAKYLDQEHLDKFHIDFAQLPFEIYKKAL